MGLPTINIEFKKLAQTLNTRAERGVLCVLIQDDTSEWDYKTFTSATQVDSSEFTTDNYNAVVRAFAAGPQKVIVARMDEAGLVSDVPNVLQGTSFNWVCAVPATFQSAVSSAVIAMNASGKRARRVKALVTGVTNANDMHVVNVANTNVTLAGESTATAMNLYLPRIGGMLAACPLTEAVTYMAFDDLDGIDEVANIDTSIDAGNLCLFKDDDVIRIARGVNTLTTITGQLTQDMKKITVVEAMDMMQEDIIKTFKMAYLGRVRNSADNQALFLAELIEYFNELAAENIIDISAYDPVAEIDLDAMRKAWTDEGIDVSDLTDAQLKQKTYRATIFVKATCRVLDAMEDLSMTISLG